MIPRNLKFISEYKNYQFYLIQERGISNKTYAYNNDLYEKFLHLGDDIISSFKMAFLYGYYEHLKLTQIWIFNYDKPIGFCVGIHIEENNIINIDNCFTAINLGYIQLFVNESHRKQGLATQVVPMIEELLWKKTELLPFVIMEQDAFNFDKSLKHCFAVNNPNPNSIDNKTILLKRINEILDSPKLINEYNSNYSQFNKEYEIHTARKKTLKNKLKTIFF